MYLYDSGIPVLVCIRKQSRSTDFWRMALIYCAIGLPTSGAGVDIPCRRSTDFWRRREVCAKSVDQLLASKVLTDSLNKLKQNRNYTIWNKRNENHHTLHCISSLFIRLAITVFGTSFFLLPRETKYYEIVRIYVVQEKKSASWQRNVNEDM